MNYSMLNVYPVITVIFMMLCLEQCFEIADRLIFVACY
jgi:hypothetical protein